MPESPFERDHLVDVVLQRFPDLAGAQFTLLSAGWDSVALDADDRLIFKFPRDTDGEAALRTEAGLLGLVRQHVSMPVPRLEVFDTPRVFSRHLKIPGEHLLTEHYDNLGEGAQQELAERMGLFYAQLHEISVEAARMAGAAPLDIWPPAEEILRLAWPVLPLSLRKFAERTMERWATLPKDPYGDRYGFFDGHGWNMAFDHDQQQLNGIYDFGDSGIGALHQEFIYSSLVSPDLTARIIGAYERQTGVPIDRQRVEVLTGTHRLWEVAGEAHLPDNLPALLAMLASWAEYAG